MKYIKRIIEQNSVLIMFYIILGWSIAFLTTFTASFYQNIIDGISNANITVFAITFYASVLILKFLISYLDEYPSKKLDSVLYTDFKIYALEKISSIDYEKYQKLGTGRLIQRIENGSLAGKSILFDFYFRLIRELIPQIVFSIYFVWKINSFITSCIFIGYIIVFIITNILLKVLYRWKEKILLHEEQLNHFLVRGIMEVVAFRFSLQYPKELKRAKNAQKIIVDSKVKVNLIHEAFFAIFAILMAFLQIGIIVYVWKTNAITIGAMVSLITLVDNAYTPIAIFNVIYVQYKLDKTAFNRYEQFLDFPDDRQLLEGDDIGTFKKDILIKNLCFLFDNQKILQNINLSINKGEKIAIIGESGCGKSTLVKIMSGLLKYKFGSILVDNKELKDINLSEFYKHVSYIPQDAPIFDGSLKENLVFDKNINELSLKMVLKKVALWDTYKALPFGMDTELGERGTLLSGGEKQRIAIARLWFDNPDLILLDESTSAMDSITEAIVIKSILENFQTKTIIFITHRLSVVHEFDRILVMRSGQIIGDGSFNELLEHNVYFRELYKASIMKSANERYMEKE